MHNKWNIKLDDIKDDEAGKKMACKWKDAWGQYTTRTAGFDLFTRVAHNLNLYEKNLNKKTFSEGSTQSIKRKIRAQTIQRVPDGEIVTQYDKNSIEQVEIEYLFKHKVMTSEFDGKDMMKNLWRMFNAAYDYGFACVRTGFEHDLDSDVRISFTQIPWNDIVPSPDCKFIEEADWYFVREYVPYSSLEALIDCETGEVSDSTYNADVVKYLVENHVTAGAEPNSAPLQDKTKGSMPTHSVEVRTLYEKGADEFQTYVPSLNAVLRTVKNCDPRKDVPVHFLILEPDPEFPMGCSSVMWTMAQQQFADAFQSIAYNTLLLAANPPLMGYGNLTPAKIKMRPHAYWDMGTNQNAKIEKFPVETTTITQYGSILENVSANMMKNLNIQDGTIASDAHTMNYSGTPQGVEAQRQDKTITINQYQKRMEIFFGEWANHALRSYISTMTGEVEITVNEETRRKIWDIEMGNAQGQDPNEELPSIINDNKIKIDFSNLSADLMTFEVRTGSLIEDDKDKQRKAIQEMLVSISQMLPAVSDENKNVFEQNIMQLMSRLFELSDIDIPVQTSARIDELLVSQALQATMEQVMGQQQQIDQMQQQIGMMPGGGGMPPEAAGAVPQEGMPPETMQQGGAPQEAPVPAEGQMPPGNAGAPSDVPIPGQGAPSPMPQI